MNSAHLARESLSTLSHILPEDLKVAFGLLDRKSRLKFLIASSFQVLLAFLEVLALSFLTLTITLSLDNFTSISNSQVQNLGILKNVFADLKAEIQIATLLLSYVALTIVKTFLSAVITFWSLNLLAKQSAQIGFNLSSNLFYRGVNLIKFGKSQENLSGITGSLDSLLIGYLGTISQLFGDVATISMICVALFFFDFQTSTLLLLLFAFLLVILHRFVNGTATRLGENVATSTTKLNRRLLDSWLVYREIILAQKVEDVLKSTLFERSRIASSRARLYFLPSLSKYFFELFIIVSALVIAGMQLWINGISEAVSSFVLIVAASSRLLPALLRLQGNLLSLKQSVGGAVFAKNILAKLSEQEEREVSVELGESLDRNFNSSVLIEKVSYIYPESKKYALKDISLSIAPGSFVAIAGASGSGKSTLVDLISGFIKPTMGSVLVSKCDPKLARRIWPGKVAFVPQDVQIFEGSILENITLLSDDQYDEAGLARCIESSGLAEDLNELDNGIHTLIGERGLKLSGGQKQRLGIARSLYRDPKLLILDEATSSLDPITEERIAQSIYKKLSDRTVIVVAHRLATVMSADKVVYLKDGLMAASGTFQELKELDPEFHKQAELSGL